MVYTTVSESFSDSESYMRTDYLWNAQTFADVSVYHSNIEVHFKKNAIISKILPMNVKLIRNDYFK